MTFFATFSTILLLTNLDQNQLFMKKQVTLTLIYFSAFLPCTSSYKFKKVFCRFTDAASETKLLSVLGFNEQYPITIQVAPSLQLGEWRPSAVIMLGARSCYLLNMSV